MFWKTTTLLAIFAWAAVAIADGKVRTWTSSDGRTMAAEFVRELDGDVTFLKDGKLIVIRVEKLSEKDQQVVKDLAAGKEPEQDPANKTATDDATSVEKPTRSAPKSKKPVSIQTRTWTDRFGARSSGKFVRVDGNDVVMNRGTRVITVPFANLSEGDQEYVREVLISQGKEADVPSGEAAQNGGEGGSVPGGGFPGARGGANNGAIGPGMPAGGGLGGGGRLPGGVGGGIGPNRGPGMNGGAGMPPNMLPPAVGGFGGNPPLAPPTGMPGGIAGPAGAGLPGGNIMPGAPTLPNGGLAAGGTPTPGMLPPAGNLPSGGSMPSMPSMPGMGSMPGTSGIGGAGFGPDLGPTSPSMERTSVGSSPSMQLEEYYQCSKCGAKLTKQESLGTSCPRCNATWGFKQDQFGNKTMTSAARGQVSSILSIVVIVVLLGVVLFIALFVGIIVAIVKATSSNASRPVHPQQMPQQRYY